MHKLILVRHAEPRVRAGVPSEQWPLSATGRHDAARLAERLRVHSLSAIVSSPEPKAYETAQIVAATLSVPLECDDALREHLRRSVPFMSRDDFERRMTELFARPNDVVFGEESATQALARFLVAIERIIANHPSGNVAIVSHGTVVALFVAALTGDDAHRLWASMAAPCHFVLSKEPLAALADA